VLVCVKGFSDRRIRLHLFIYKHAVAHLLPYIDLLLLYILVTDNSVFAGYLEHTFHSYTPGIILTRIRQTGYDIFGQFLEHGLLPKGM